MKSRTQHQGLSRTSPSFYLFQLPYYEDLSVPLFGLVVFFSLFSAERAAAAAAAVVVVVVVVVVGSICFIWWWWHGDRFLKIAAGPVPFFYAISRGVQHLLSLVDSHHFFHTHTRRFCSRFC